MDINKIILDAHDAGIILFVENNRLGYKSKNKVLNKDVAKRISEHKNAIIDFLKKEQEIDQDPLSEKLTSLSQQRIWLIEKLSDHTSEFNIPVNIELDSNWHVDKIKQALSDVVQQHHILRSVYLERNEKLWQKAIPDFILNFKVINLEHEECNQSVADVDKLLAELGQSEFDLTTEPPIKVSIILLPNNRKLVNITFHHIAMDDTSCQLFLNQAFDNTFKPKQEQSISQYSEYAKWQDSHLHSDNFKIKAQEYADELNGIQPLHPIPLLNSHSNKTTNTASKVICELPTDVVKKALDLQRSFGLTPFSFYQSCLAKFISHWTNTNDSVMGTPVIHRPTAKLSNTIGCFLNLQVIRHQFCDGESLTDMLMHASETHKRLLGYQEVPFEHLLKALNPHRTPYFSPIFQILISMHYQQENSDKSENNLTWSHYGTESSSTKYDLTIRVAVKGNKVKLIWQYKKDLFSDTLINQMAHSFEDFLTAAVNQPTIAINQLQIVRSENIAALYNTDESKEEYRSIINVIEKTAKQHANKPAIEYGLTSISYQQMYHAIQEAKSILRDNGVVKGDHIAIKMQRSPQMLITMLATMAVGASYVPLDPDYPQERLKYIIDYSNCKICVQDCASTGDLDAAHHIVITNDIFSQPPQNGYAQSLSETFEKDDTAYVIFTSGSTGVPKGVEVSHANLVNFICSMTEKPGITENDKLLAVTPISFDISILELFAPLTVGACVVIAEQNKRDGFSLKTRLEQYDITVMQATPAGWLSIIDAGWIGCNALKALSGGEALPSELASQILEHAGSLWNMYGPTETTVWSSCIEVTNPRSENISLGQPIFGTSIHILDENNFPCSFEQQGEIVIAGNGVAKGYLNNPKLTNERFFKLQTKQGEVDAYRTGDLGYISPNGKLVCNGRNDHQVKLRGFRIELPEIEAQLQRISNINQACTVIKELANKSKRLVAYIVPASNIEHANSTDIKAAAKATLPTYMVPDDIEFLSHLPLTPSGKVDRNALTALPLSNIESLFVAPTNELEELLISIWCDSLGQEKLSITDNFFACGGDSIIAVKVVSAVNKHGYIMSNSMIFAHQTVQELAHHLTKGDQQAENQIDSAEYEVNGIEILGADIAEDDLNALLCEFE